LTLALEYRLRSGPVGSGEAINMSSNGLLFRCCRELPPGELIEVHLRWPFLLKGVQPLRLCLWGIVVRREQATAAMSISKYEFVPLA